jgi:hypothetical protein
MSSTNSKSSSLATVHNISDLRNRKPSKPSERTPYRKHSADIKKAVELLSDKPVKTIVTNPSGSKNMDDPYRYQFPSLTESISMAKAASIVASGHSLWLAMIANAQEEERKARQGAADGAIPPGGMVCSARLGRVETLL